MNPLTVRGSGDASYAIIDGDIPCTPEIEPSFGYLWNFCADVTKTSIPAPCSKYGKNGAVLQWAEFGPDDMYCYIIGHFDSGSNELQYNLLNVADPTEGISLEYPAGEPCNAQRSSVLRTATIDVHCSNVDAVILSAEEPSTCNYHLVMKSYRGCPTVSCRGVLVDRAAIAIVIVIMVASVISCLFNNVFAQYGLLAINNKSLDTLHADRNVL